MRRATTIAGACAAAAIGWALIAGGSASSYRVDAVFRTAKGMVSGQLVEIAGARVGTVSGVQLIRSSPSGDGYEARMELTLNRSFAPFHSDARCQILPQGPISENYVECNPGSAARPLLARGPTGVPTVPVRQTAAALDVQDVLNVFTMPTDQRLGLLIDELGVGTAGRGADFNAILTSANPALSQARQVLAELDVERRQVGDAIGQTDHVLDVVAQRDQQVRGFVDGAAAVARTTAAHRSALGSAIGRLPAMLANLDSGLRAVNHVTAVGTPLLRSLHASAPGLRILTRTLTSFSRDGLPAVDALGGATAVGRPALSAARPLVSQLRRFGSSAGPSASLLDHLLSSVRDTGSIEATLALINALAGFSSGYDSFSHFLTVTAQVFPQCLVNEVAPACRQTYDSPGQGSIPLNDPSAGPQSVPIPTAGQSSPTGTASPTPSSSTIGAGRMRALLTYLLK